MHKPSLLVPIAVSLLVGALGCQTEPPGAAPPPPPTATGGQPSPGPGPIATGGAPAPSGTGGQPAPSTGGRAPGSGGAPAPSGTGGAPAMDTRPPSPADTAPPPPPSDAAPAPAQFSFFVTSMEAMIKLSGNPKGFGGDLRFGMPTGLEGADKICQTIASEVGGGGRTWRAFLSATKGKDGAGPVHAIDRIGPGPWYDRAGRLVAMNVADLLAMVTVNRSNMGRPKGDPQATGIFLDEKGVASKQGSIDNHDTLTGSDRMGRLARPDPASTCMDWTSAVGPGSERRVACGHSWGWGSWTNAHQVGGCAPGINLVQNGAGSGNTVGAGGGYGGIYCFALAQ